MPSITKEEYKNLQPMDVVYILKNNKIVPEKFTAHIKSYCKNHREQMVQCYSGNSYYVTRVYTSKYLAKKQLAYENLKMFKQWMEDTNCYLKAAKNHFKRLVAIRENKV
jgi:hypothetical protein